MKSLRLIALGLFILGGVLVLTGKSFAEDPKYIPIYYMEAEESRFNLEYVPGLFPPGYGNPLGTKWHEIWPVYCRMDSLTSWEDNGDGKLSRCDQIDMKRIDIPGQPIEWYHVENVTLTIWWEPIHPPFDSIGAADFMGSPTIPDSMVLKNPVCTWWHQIYPPDNYSREFHIASWIDNNGNGKMDSCDWIDRDHRSWVPDSLSKDTVHIIRVATDITLKRKFKPTPVGTQWHELRPIYSQRWHIDNWIDNGSGKLDVCDYIKMYKKPNPTDTTWYHVDGLTKTIFVRKKPFPFTDSLYLEFTGMTGPPPPSKSETKSMTEDTIIVNAVGTWWHASHPDSQIYECIGYEDNGNGYLDPSDQIRLKRWKDGYIAWYHVERVATDIILKKRSPFPTPTMTEWGMIILVILLVSSGVYVALKRRRRAMAT